MRAARARGGWMLLALAAVFGCGGEPADPERVVVAWLGDEPQHLVDLQRYLDANLLEEHRQLPDDERDEVSSRLFDAWIDEQLLLAEARRRGLSAGALEVAAWLEFVRDDDEGPLVPRNEDDIRRQLTLQKLEEQTAEREPPVSDDEVRAWITAHHERFATEPRVRLRSLRFDDEETAAKVHREIRRGRITFNEAVVTWADSPDQGAPVEMSLASMIETQRQALEGLRPGQTSSPVESSGGAYLFQVVSWMKGPTAPSERQWSDARDELLRERGRAAYRDLLSSLRENTEIRLKPGGLPFSYRPQDSDS